MNSNDFWRNLDGKRIAIVGGAVFLGWALLENAYRDGLRTGLLLASEGGELRYRDLDHGFPFGPWLLIAAIVGFVGWRKGWWGGNGPSGNGRQGHGRSLPPAPWTARPSAAPTAPPAPPAPPAWEERRPEPAQEVRVPVTVAGQAPAAPAASPAAPVPGAGAAPPAPAADSSATPAATPEATSPEYRRTVGDPG